MAEPSLGEVLNFGVDPALGGAARPTFDNRQLLSTLNDNARFQAENTWKKYNLFQQNLSNLYKDIGDVSQLDVATQDRQALDEDRKKLLDSIYKNPKEFFGSGNLKKRADIEGLLSKYRSNATESKLNRVFDMAHRQFMEQNPELNTDENKQVIESYWQQSLGKRKSYNLNMPTVFDYNKFSGDIFKSPGVTQTLLKNEYTPDNKFIDEYAETTIGRDAFLRNWMAGLLGTDKYGHSLQTYADQQFKKLTDDQKQNLGVKTPEDLWKVIGEQTFGGKQDIITKQAGKRIANPFELEMVKSKGRLELLKKRYGFMAGMEALKQGNRKDLETYKLEIKGLSPEQQNKSLTNLTEGIIDDAISSGTTVAVNGEPQFKLKVSDQLLNMYKKSKKVGSSTIESIPQDIVVSPDGEKITTVYYTDKDKKEIDTDKTRTFTKDEFTVDVGKGLFGITGVRKMADVKPRPKTTKAPSKKTDPLGIMQ